MSSTEPDPDEEIATELGPGESIDDFPKGCHFIRASDRGVSPLRTTPSTSTDFSVYGIGATEYRSVIALQRLDDWPDLRRELHHAIEVKKALTL